MQEENNLIVFHNAFLCNPFISHISPFQETTRLAVVLWGLLFDPHGLSDSSTVTDQGVSLCLPSEAADRTGNPPPASSSRFGDVTAVLRKDREESGRWDVRCRWSRTAESSINFFQVRCCTVGLHEQERIPLAQLWQKGQLRVAVPDNSLLTSILGFLPVFTVQEPISRL